MSATTYRRCQLCIISEFILEQRLTETVVAHGGHGYTIHEVRGASCFEDGIRRREGAGDTDRTIEIKIICERAIAEAIAGQVLSEFAPNFSVRVLLSEVEVFRPGKY